MPTVSLIRCTVTIFTTEQVCGKRKRKDATNDPPSSPHPDSRQETSPMGRRRPSTPSNDHSAGDSVHDSALGWSPKRVKHGPEPDISQCLQGKESGSLSPERALSEVPCSSNAASMAVPNNKIVPTNTIDFTLAPYEGQAAEDTGKETAVLANIPMAVDGAAGNSPTCNSTIDGNEDTQVTDMEDVQHSDEKEATILTPSVDEADGADNLESRETILATTEDPTSNDVHNECDCKLAGCRSCRPCKTRATHCGHADCSECGSRRAGFDFWDATDQEENEELYTEGLAALAKSYDGGRNVMVMVLSEGAMRVIKNSVVEGRRYRALKRKIDSELKQIVIDSEPVWERYMTSLEELRKARARLKFQRTRPTPEEEDEVQRLSADFRSNQSEYRALKTQRLLLGTELRNAERQWIAAMRDVEYEHDFILEDAKILTRTSEPNWVEDDYRYHRTLRDRRYEEGDVYDGGDTNTDISGGAEYQRYAFDMRQKYALDMQRPTEGNEMDQQAEPTLYELVEMHEQAVARAQKTHDDVRRSYDLLYQDYAHEHPDQSEEELANGFGPQYVRIGQKYIKALKDAETGQAEAKKYALDAGVDIHENLDPGETFLREKLEEEERRCTDDVDRNKLRRWRDASMEPLPPGTTFMDLADSDASRSVSKPSKRDRSNHRPEAHRHRSGASGSTSPEAAKPKPTKRRRPKVRDLFDDSISVYNEESYLRENIDAWAIKVRGGYY